MRRILFLLIALMMVGTASFVFATGEVESGAAAGDFPDADLVNPAGEFPIVDEPITISVFVARGQEESDQPFFDWYEEKTNVVVDWDLVPRSSYAERAQIYLATGDIPDITNIGSAAIPATEDGLFFPISDIWDEWGEATPRWVEARPEIWRLVQSSDGKTYTWPWTTVETPEATYRHKMWIESSWLERVGMDKPTTIEEFEAVLRAFQAQDANGNGDPNDEIPLSTSSPRPFNDFNSPLLLPFVNAIEWVRMEDGRVIEMASSEDLREGLAWHAMLYEDGLIYSEALTQDRSSQWRLNEQFEGWNMIGSYIGQHHNYAMNWDSPRWQDYDWLDVLEGPDGVLRGSARDIVGNFNTQIAADAQYPIAAFRWLDWMLTEEGHLTTQWGLEGEHWEAARTGEIDALGEQAIYRQIADQDEFAIDTMFMWWGAPSGYFIDDRMWIAPDPAEVNDQGQTKLQIWIEAGLAQGEHLIPIEERWPYPPIPSSILEEYTLVRTAINDVVKQWSAEFIAGSRDIETDWDDYVNELDRAGIDRYVELMQQAYDEFQG